MIGVFVSTKTMLVICCVFTFYALKQLFKDIGVILQEAVIEFFPYLCYPINENNIYDHDYLRYEG